MSIFIESIKQNEGCFIKEGRNIWEFYREKENFDWRWRLRDLNQEIIGASTEGYKNLEDCISNATRVSRSNSPSSDEIKRAIAKRTVDNCFNEAK